MSYKFKVSQDAFSKFRKRQRRIHPVDTGRKLNVHKTVRGRPGRLLNVLCTFNLRPVSTGHNLLLGGVAVCPRS